MSHAKIGPSRNDFPTKKQVLEWVAKGADGGICFFAFGKTGKCELGIQGPVSKAKANRILKAVTSSDPVLKKRKAAQSEGGEG